MTALNSMSPCVCMRVRKLAREISHIYDECLRPAGIRSSQFGLLRCIATLPEPFISDIGRVLSMDQTTVTRNVDKLVKMGLVRTRADRSDPRRKAVALTASGKAKLAEARALWEEAQARMQASLGAQDMENLLRLLQSASAAIHGADPVR